MRDLIKMGLEQAGYVVAATSGGCRSNRYCSGVEVHPRRYSRRLQSSFRWQWHRCDWRNPAGTLPQGSGAHFTGDISGKTLSDFAQHEIPYLHKPAKLKDVVQAVETLVVRQTGERAAQVSEAELMWSR